jgi:hypothetical protein
MKSDFNGDGKADVLWQNTSGSRALWLMNGTTFGSSIFLPSVATSWKIVGSGDFNGDNKPDILWQNSSGARAIWLMNGITYSSGVYFGTAATSWNIRNY